MAGQAAGGGRRAAWPVRLPAREVMLTLGLFAVLLAAVAAVGATTRSERRYDLGSGGPQGLLALRLWLAELGYRVETNAGARFTLPAEAKLLFVYPNAQPYSAAEAAELSRWVERGGTLALIGPDGGDRQLIDAFGVRPLLAPLANPALPLRQAQPWLPAAPAELGRLGLDAPLDLSGAPGAVAVVAAEGGLATLAVQRRGAGLVWHLSRHHDLVNAGLRDGDQGHIALALLREVPAGALVVFDAYHLTGPVERQAGTLQDWLYGTPAGWATLFCLVVLFVYLLLQGVRLGPPLPAPAATRRRAAAEYVTAMAGLQRRARLGRAVAAHHKRRLKLGLGRPLQLNPDLDDAVFVERLRQADDRLDERQLAAIRRLLADLDGQPDEARLVRLAAAVDRVLERS